MSLIGKLYITLWKVDRQALRTPILHFTLLRGIAGPPATSARGVVHNVADSVRIPARYDSSPGHETTPEHKGGVEVRFCTASIARLESARPDTTPRQGGWTGLCRVTPLGG
jgi:hypothetical protein